MKTQTQTTAALAHVASLIESIPIAALTNIEADGSLACRPMAALEMDANGALWFLTDLRSDMVLRIGVMSLSFCDAARGTFVSLSGFGVIDTDRGRIERLWSPLVEPLFPEGLRSKSLALLKFVPASAEFWDAPSGQMLRRLGEKDSGLTDVPMGTGVHGSVTGLLNRPEF